MGTVKELTMREFNEQVCDLDCFDGEWRFLGERPVVIDFYAAWCGPCQGVSRALEELAAEYADRIDFYKVDIDRELQLTSIFEVRSVPTLLFVPLEGVPHTMVGAHPKMVLKQIIEDLLLR